MTKNNEDENLDPVVQLAIKELNEIYGGGAVILGKDVDRTFSKVVCPTSSLSLDNALGVGGIPYGSIVEIYGPEMAGKTTLAIHILAQSQKLLAEDGHFVGIIDMEHGMELDYAEALGLDMDWVMFSQPGDGEEALDTCERLIKTGKVRTVIVDSVAALVPRAEVEGKITDQHVARQARMMSSFLRQISPLVNKTNTILIFINQLREKVGGYGNPETTPGGRALKFYTKIRIDLRAIERINVKGVQVGNIIRAKVVKNKYAPPYRTAQFELVFGKGIDEVGEIADLAVLRNIVKKAGSWYSYDGETICQGREALKEWLESNPEIMGMLKEEVYNVEE